MFICAVGFAESLKRKNSEPTPERVPSPQPPPPIVEETAPIEAEGQDSGRETRKNKKRVKMAAKKKTPESETFEPLDTLLFSLNKFTQGVRGGLNSPYWR